MVREEIWPAISTWQNIEDLIFIQDGAPPHFAIVGGEWLNGHFPGRWMGCDVTPCDFFFGVGRRSKSTLPNQPLWKNLKGDYVKLCLPSHKSFLLNQLMWFTVGLRSWWQMLAPKSHLK